MVARFLGKTTNLVEVFTIKSAELQFVIMQREYWRCIRAIAQDYIQMMFNSRTG
jgi:hypothetical protein